MASVNIKVGADGSGAFNVFNQLDKRVHGLSHELKEGIAEAFSVVAIGEAIKKTVEFGEELVNSAKRMGITVEEVQILKAAAKNAGTEIGVLAKAFEKLELAKSKALNGDKDKIKAFSEMGISVDVLKTSRVSDLATNQVSKSLNEKSVAELTNSLNELFGKSFGQLIPVLKQDFDELGGKMRKLGLLMSTETAVKLHTLGKELSIIANLFVNIVAPALLSFVDMMISAAQSYLDWVDNKLGRGKEGENSKNGFWSKSGNAVAGVTTGLLTWWDSFGATLGVPGAEKKAAERYAQTEEYLNKSFGFMSSDGIVNKAADLLGNSNEPIGEKFRKTIAEMRKEIQKEIEELKHPHSIAPFDDEDGKSISKKSLIPFPKSEIFQDNPSKNFQLEIGNTLGINTSGRLQSLARQTNDILKKQVEIASQQLDVLTDISDQFTKLMPGTGFVVNL